jgi:aspartyl aminopeptidase
MQALIDGSGDDALASEPAVKAVALFDHEECGSSSAQGAMATMTAVWGVSVCSTL